MTTPTSHITRLLAVAAALSTAALALPATGLAYGWPVKPFDEPHPLRGSFGDPRTVFAGSPTLAGLETSPCACTFHEGVDISAPDGTAVYPVLSGVVRTVITLKGHEMVSVESGSTAFEYWHIAAGVRPGEQVTVGSTILGRILHEAGHVHLTEIDNGVIVNPLEPGHLTPYRDTTVPAVGAISFHDAAGGSTPLPNFVTGAVEIDAEAYDSPSTPVPGVWHGMPVTPAVVSWHIERWNGTAVTPERAIYDVRRTIPSNADFWRVYARGTFQNMSVFGRHYSWLEPGCFRFRLTPGSFDTRALPDGVYTVVVTASDIAGNKATGTQRFTVANRADA
jgi:hypothetical protein